MVCFGTVSSGKAARLVIPVSGSNLSRTFTALYFALGIAFRGRRLGEAFESIQYLVLFTTAQRGKLHYILEGTLAATVVIEDTMLDLTYKHLSTQYHLGSSLTGIAERTQEKRP